MKLSVIILIVFLSTILLLSASKILPVISISLHKHEFINYILKYQLFALSIALIVLGITLMLTPQSKVLLQSGNFSILAAKEMWLGINGKTSWKTNAFQLAFFISLATGIFMFLALKQTGSLKYFQWSFIPLVLLISLTNSFSEEVIYRFAINGNLTGYTSKLAILLLSAVLFGLPHYAGAPGGFIGILMSGVLGYILSKATYETQGLGIAWGIHFLQDVIIFTSIFMMNIKS